VKRAALIDGAAHGRGGIDGAARGAWRDANGGVEVVRGAGRGVSCGV
jgi:hypothetical protein